MSVTIFKTYAQGCSMNRILPVFKIGISLFIIHAALLQAADQTNSAPASFGKNAVLPDEYVTTPGLGLALDNSGVAAVNGIEAIQINPALLAIEKQYLVSASYNWPVVGREFYQAGILDSTTSSLAAAATYTGFIEKLNEDDLQQNFAREDSLDSQAKRRIRLGLAQNMGSVSFGMSGQYLEASELRIADAASSVAAAENQTSASIDQPAKIVQLRGTALNIGMAAAITPQIFFGAAAENIANKKIALFAPTIYRAGFSYIFSPQASVNLDYKQRQKLEMELVELENPKKQEQSATGSLVVKVYDVFRLLAGYTKGLNEDKNSAAAGIALVNQKLSLSYMVRSPDLKKQDQHQAIDLGLNIVF